VGDPVIESAPPQLASTTASAADAEAHRTNRASRRVADCATTTQDIVAVTLFFMAELQDFDFDP
jgi:hypothetical protein